MFICMTIAGLGTKTCVCVVSGTDRLLRKLVLPGERVLRRSEMARCLCSELEGYAQTCRRQAKKKAAA